MLGVTTHAWAQIQPTNVEEGLSAGSANYLNNHVTTVAIHILDSSTEFGEGNMMPWKKTLNCKICNLKNKNKIGGGGCCT